jgi:3-phosphoglycerate kinase
MIIIMIVIMIITNILINIICYVIGPLGYIEMRPFSEGTYKLVDYVASLTSPTVTTIICGGDTVSAVEENG